MVLVSLRELYVLSFSMRKDILYESVKKFVKTRKEDLNAYFTASLRIRKFIILCCDDIVDFMKHPAISQVTCFWTIRP